MIGGAVAGTPEITSESIKAVAELGAETGVLVETEKQIIHRVVEFNNTTAGAIMTPRVKIFALDINEKPVEIKKKLTNGLYSRVSVFEGDKDDIIGVLLVREFFKKYFPKINIKSVMTSAYFVTQEKRIDELLREMQRKNIHMSIVLDPEGGVAGLVTMEDILEELVGDIYDETDINEHLLKHINKNTFEIDSDVSLKDIDEALKVSLPSKKVSSFSSLNEFILNKLGHIPKPGEQVKLDNVIIEIRRVQKHKIKQVRIKRR